MHAPIWHPRHTTQIHIIHTHPHTTRIGIETWWCWIEWGGVRRITKVAIHLFGRVSSGRWRSFVESSGHVLIIDLSASLNRLWQTCECCTQSSTRYNLHVGFQAHVKRLGHRNWSEYAYLLSAEFDRMLGVDGCGCLAWFCCFLLTVLE